MKGQELQTARIQFLQHFAHGSSWAAAAQAAGLPMSRTTAWRLRKRAAQHPDQAVIDHRHGHPYLVSPQIRDWIRDFCQREPSPRTAALQSALRSEFATHISITHLNRLRRELGVPSPRTNRPKKVTAA